MNVARLLKHIALLCIPALLLSGCSLLNRVPIREQDLSDTAPLVSYPKDNAPIQMIQTTDYWVSLVGNYTSSDYAVSVSDTVDILNPVYTVENVSIWFFDASDTGAVWCEKSEEHYTYKLYCFEDEQITVLHQTENAADFQAQNIAIYDHTVYYCLADHAQLQATLYAYDIATQTTHTVHTVPFTEETLPHSFSVEERFITLADSKTVIILDRMTYDITKTHVLPADVERVFAVSYNADDDTCALYYSDEDSEDIGILDPQNSRLTSLYTFAENHYAYHDTIRCIDGHLYWIAQSNVSGYVADHYRLIDYDYKTHRATETPQAFAFFEKNGEKHILCFDGREYETIELYNYD